VSRALLVEDDPLVSELITAALSTRQIACDVVTGGTRAIERVRHDPPDLLLLDLGLPGIDGTEVLRRLRRSSHAGELPIIVVSARGEEIDRVVGIEMGADDYIVKPFSVREFLARVTGLLRRVNGHLARHRLRAGALAIDLERRDVRLHGAPLHLTAREFDLLAALVRAQGRVLRRSQLLEEAWGYALRGGHRTRTVDVHVRLLRAKLGDEARRLVTRNGVGYAFRTDS
jgi:DNA-binding response OmpR family regulator